MSAESLSAGRRALFAVVLLGVALLLGVGVAEGALRILMPAPKVYRMLLPGKREFQPDSRFIHGITGTASYAVNEQGIRGRDFGPDSAEYRILLVGGSTTECGLLDDSENWGTIAERDLGVTGDGRRVWVGNVGRSGLTSRDHAVTVKYLLAQYPRIDVVVVLLGVNDLTAALRQAGSYRSPTPLSDPAAERIQVRNAFAMSPGGFREMLTPDLVPVRTPWHKRAHLYQLGRRARVGWQARKVVSGRGGADIGGWRANRQSASRIIDSLPDLMRPLADYRASLEAIVAEARKRNTEVVFMTQPALWKDKMTPAEERLIWLGGTGRFQEEPGHAYYSIPALAKAMDRYNAEGLAVCRAAGLACLDLASRIPRDTSMFYDDVHFTEAGAAAVGHSLAAHLRQAKPDLFGRVPRR